MKYIIGAYATAPSSIFNKSLEYRFYEKLIESIPEIRGLEIPFFGNDIHSLGYKFLLDMIDTNWNNIITCIPGTMANLSKNPHFGLASDNSNGRNEAILMCKRVNQTLHKINDFFGKKSVFAIQLATAPSVPVTDVSSSKDSLLRSMEEILKWDWDGSKIIIEHADQSHSNLPFEKGFLSLESEIDVLKQLSNVYNVGITINWARSAIEGRSVFKPIEHINLALKYDLLAGLIFSGVSNNDKNYGSWKDTHMPFAQSYNVEYFEKNSLLTYENIFNTLKLIYKEKFDYLGLKLNSMPMDHTDIQRRVGLNKNAVMILENIALDIDNLNN
jgi:hypothetical protein